MHYDEGDCWIIITGKVYDVSSFLDEHPGGVEVIMEYAGLDATSDFEDLPHPAEAYNMLEKYWLGRLVVLPLRDLTTGTRVRASMEPCNCIFKYRLYLFFCFSSLPP